MNDYFHWDRERILFELGALEIRYYRLFLTAGLLVSMHLSGPRPARKACQRPESAPSAELDPEFPLTMGQLLSGPIALLCGTMALFSRRCGLLSPPKPPLEPTARQEDGSTEATARAGG